MGAFATVEQVARVAGGAGSAVVPLLAVVVHWHALFLAVEHPPVGALLADLAVPVPNCTAVVRHLLDGCQNAFSMG